MEVHFTVDEERRLSEVGAISGKSVGLLVRQAVLDALDEDARFETAVRRGVESADGGALVDHAEVISRLENRYRA